MKALIQTLIVAVLIEWAAPTMAQTLDELPSVDALEVQLETLRSNTAVEPEVREQSVARLQLAVARRQELSQLEARIRDYQQAITTAPAALAEAESRVQEFVAEKLPADLAELPLTELELMLSQVTVATSALRRKLSAVEAEINNEKAFDLERALSEARTRAERPLNDESDPVILPRVSALLAELGSAVARAQVEALEQRRLSRPARLALWNAEAELLDQQLAAAEKRLAQLRTVVTESVQGNANQREAHARETAGLLRDEPAAVRELAESVVHRAQALSSLVARQDSINDAIVRTSGQLERLEHRFLNLNRQLEFARLDSSPEFGAALRAQRDNLINVQRAEQSLDAYERQLTDARLELFKLDATRERDNKALLIKMLANLGEEPNAVVGIDGKRVISDLLEDESRIVAELSNGYSQQIDDLVRLTAQYRELINNSKAYAQLLDQHLLWIPSANAMSLDTLRGLASSGRWLANEQLDTLALKGMLEQAQRRPLLLLAGLLLLAVLLRQRPRFRGVLRAMRERVGKVQFDTARLTLVALMLTVLLALPGPLAVFGLSRLLHSGSGLTHALSEALSYGAIVYFVLQFVLQGVRRDGLAELHFNWRANAVRSLKTNLPWFMAVFIPAVVLNLFLEVQGNAVVRDSLGRIAFVFATLVLAVFAYRISDPRHGVWELPQQTLAAGAASASRNLRFQLLVLLPVLVAGLSVYGYHYTAVQLDAYLLNSGLVLITATLSFYFFERVFAVSERRLTLERARARRVAAAAQNELRVAAVASGDAVPETLNLEEIDLQTISTQTRALLKLVIAVVTVLVLWNVWSDFLPAFEPLDSIVLWDVIESVDGAQITAAITLWDLALAIFVAVVTVLGVKNIPGTLEVALLSRLSLETGTSYAVTTISRYVIAIAGTVIALQILGAQWSKLQWLVAALSVGLGFGLQEIVANFVSGIVILFERPIRIGDTVTVGDQWGTVSRIRIRATTIVDWDRREVLIPNKTFITERLINWTLTDPITRIVVKVGVAYGSDLALTERLLLEIAKDNDQVLDDPPPAAVFLNFGDSSLEFQLRVFVRGVRDIIPATHALHLAIDRSFREHAIEIAFPQRDLHLDDRPIEVQLVEAGKSNDARS